MGVKIEGVDLKVEPIEAESLNQAQDGFPEKGVDAVFCTILEKQGDHAVAKDQSGESIRPLGLMLDIKGGPKVKVLCEPLGERGPVFISRVAHKSSDPDRAE